MNIYLQELKSLRKSTIIWTCSLIATAVLFLSLYSSIAGDTEEFKKMLGNYPESIRAMLGINLDYITSILGFYAMVFSFIVLCGAIQAMNLGLSVLSKEARERTADFLLTKPVSRAAILSAKLSAAFTALLVTNVVFCAASTITANIFKTTDYNGKIFFLINLTMFFVQLIFLSVGMFISVFFNRLKNVLPISLGVVFGVYMAGAVLASGKEDAARFISPFRYFDVISIIQNAGYETAYLLVGAVIVAVSTAGVYRIFMRKDIHAVS